MTLRRFPWKAPRISDNSYKLFVSEPTEEERRTKEYPQAQRLSASEPASRQPSDGTENGHQHHHHHRDGSAKSDPTSRNTAANSGNPETQSTVAPSSVSTNTSASQSSQPTVIKGPWRLLRLLPRETRHIIGRMLELDPNKRATLDEILEDPWVLRTPICQQEITGEIARVDSHAHTLEPGSGSTPAPSKK